MSAAPAATASLNRLVLQAQVVERAAMRYTPAGLPALDLSLKHESQVAEDGQPRKVSLEIKAVAIGVISRQAGQLAVGSEAQFAGFLAAARNGRGIVFHVTAIRPSSTIEFSGATHAPAPW